MNWQLIATFFNVGRIKKAPGTWGTIATLPLALFLGWAGPLWGMPITIAIFVVGLFAAEAYEKQTGAHDSKEIVIDEVVGFLITMTWLPMTWQAYLAGFCLFRVLDILKPFPIGYLDKKVQGGIGVMADDVAAGIIANVLLQIVYTKTDWLGAQILN